MTAILSDAQWQAVIDEARTGIDRWNERGKCVYRLERQEHGGVQFVITSQTGQGPVERRGLARRQADGVVFSVKFKRQRGGYQMVYKPGPKSWDRLGDKSAAQVVKATKLLGFIEHRDAYVTSTRSHTLDDVE